MDRCGTHRPAVWRPGAPAPARLRANRRARRRRCRRSPASGRGSAGRGARHRAIRLRGGGRGALDLPALKRRLFSQISKNGAAEPLTDYGKILGLIRKTTTTTGLRVRAYLDTKD